MRVASIAIITALALTTVPREAIADACSDYHLAREHYDAVEAHITKKLSTNDLTGQESLELARLSAKVRSHLIIAQDAVRHPLENDSWQAITIDSLTEIDRQTRPLLDLLAKRPFDSEKNKVLGLYTKIVEILVAIGEARREAFNAVCP